MGVFRLLIYGIIFGTWAVTLAYDVFIMPRFFNQWWITKLYFITSINLVLQTAYFLVCLVRAIVDSLHETKDKGPHKRHPATPTYWQASPLHRVCDFAYATVIFPLGFATSLLFWSLYLVEPTYVMPEWAEAIMPKWYNHMTHTAPIPFLLVDTLFICHHMPSRTTGSKVVLGLIIIYFIIIGLVRAVEGYWVYGIFDVLSAWQRVLLMLAAGFVFWLLYLLGDLLNAMLWGGASHAPATLGATKVK